jgi:parallel beta-helix repeat protein
VFVKNDLFNNTSFGILVRTGATPRVAENSIYNNRDGIAVTEGGLGTFENNSIFRQTEAGFVVRKGGAPESVSSCWCFQNTLDCEDGLAKVLPGLLRCSVRPSRQPRFPHAPPDHALDEVGAGSSHLEDVDLSPAVRRLSLDDNPAGDVKNPASRLDFDMPPEEDDQGGGILAALE